MLSASASASSSGGGSSATALLLEPKRREGERDASESSLEGEGPLAGPGVALLSAEERRRRSDSGAVS